MIVSATVNPVYETPSVEVIEIMVEQGFAASSGETENIVFGEGDNDW